MSKWSYKNRTAQGAAGLGAAISYFTSLGYGVSLPLLDTCPYDLIIDVDGTLQRVQVKTSGFKRRGRFTLKVATEGGNRSNGNSIRRLDTSEIELLFALVEDGTCYCIPSEDVGGVCQLTLGEKYDKFVVRRGSQEAEGAVLERQ